jgi:hypothetical protein
MILWGLFSAAAVLLTPGAAGGQTVEEYRARVEEISKLLEDLEQARLERERVRDEQLMSRLDTIRVGKVMLVTTPEHAMAIETKVRRDWQKLEPALRSDSAAKSGDEFALYYRLPYPPGPGIVEFRRSLAREIGILLAARLDPSGTFLNSLPFEPLGKQEREIIYSALATSARPVANACFLGDLVSCRSVIGLIQPPEAPLVWYEPEVPSWSAASLPSLFARQLLLDVALELGGDGTYARVSSSGRSGVEEKLSGAAGVEADTLISRWREAVLNARPKTQAVVAFEGLAALAWVLGLALLATRSSRWRSG